MSFNVLARIARDVARLDRKRAAFASDNRRVAEQARNPGAVEGCRHDEQLQVRPQPLLGIAGEREAEVGIERAFVEFVKQDRGDALERGVIEDQVGEDALGHDLDAGLARDLGAEANPVPDHVTDGFTQGLGHAVGGGARSESARFQHQDLALFRPALLRQHQRYARGLAGARRSDQHHGVALGQCRGEPRQRLIDRKRLHPYFWHTGQKNVERPPCTMRRTVPEHPGVTQASPSRS